MKLNKLIAGAAAIAMLGSLVTAVPAMAVEQETMVITVSEDYQFNGKSDSTNGKGSNSGSIEVRRDGDGDYLGVLEFDLTELKALKETGAAIDSVQLQLVTERSKSSNTELEIKSIDINLNSNTTYSDITTAMNTGNNVGSITLKRGIAGKAIFDGTKDSDSRYGDLSLWTSTTDITEAVDTEEDNNIILTLRNSGDDGQQQKFISSKLATDYESGTKTRRSTALYNFGIIDTNKVLTDDEYAALDVSSVVPQLIVTYTPYDTTGKVARIGSAYYETLADAINAASSDDTVVLVDDAVIDSPLYVNKDGNKNITLSGNNHTVTLNGTLEFSNSNKFNVSDVTFDGNSGVDMKNSTVITANNVSFNKLSLGGAGNASKGTLTSCNVANLSTYGRITLDSTSVGEVVFSNVKASGDTPCIIMTNNSTVASAKLLKVEKPTLPYTLFYGEGAPATITGVPEGYEYSNGVLSKKQSETSPSASYKLIQEWADADDPASAWKLTVNPGTYTIDSFTLLISDGTTNYPATNSPNSTQVSDGAVVFGVAVNRAASFVQGMTLNITSGSASSPIEATVESAE